MDRVKMTLNGQIDHGYCGASKNNWRAQTNLSMAFPVLSHTHRKVHK